MNTLDNRQMRLNNLLFKVLPSDAVGDEAETISRDNDGSYIIYPIDVQEVERMCIDFGLNYELLGMWGIRIWRP